MSDDAAPPAGGTGDVSTVAAPEPAEREPPSWDEVKQLRAEAARRRQAQRAAETERDTLRGRVDASDKREVERLAGDRLQNASDIWLTADIASLRDEEGSIDTEKVSERLDQVLEQRPHWAKTGPVDFSSGVRAPLQKPQTFAEALKRSIHGR